MVLDLFGLMGAYAAGSCRDAFTTVYSSLVVSAVFAYITHVFVTYAFRWVLTKKRRQGGRGDPEKHGGKGSTSASSNSDDDNRHRREEEHDVLMLLATFVVTITYVAGLGPPGGFWSDSQDGHRVSDPIMQDHYSARYQAFFVCNTTAFVASLLIIVLLMNKELSKALTAARFAALYGFIAVALIGLVGAYAAGSCREADATIYVVSLAGAVLACIFLQVAVTQAMDKGGCCCWGHTLLTTIRDSTSKWLEKIKDSFTAATTHGATRDPTQGDKVLEKNRSLVMLLATLVVSITYAAGLDPPGGLWPDDRDGHKGGDPVLLATHPTRYKVFFYSNSAAFVTSLVVIIMVQSRFLLRRHTLHAAMILDLFGLITAYAAGSGRDLTTSIYVVALAGLVLVYVVIHIVFFTLEDQHTDNHQEDPNKLDKRREMLLLLAILAATLTYQAGLTPPGGFWSADDEFGHRAGFPALLDNYPPRYNAFFYCNGASFMASVTLIVLLVNPTLYKPGIRCYALYVCMVVGMFGLMGAYAAGSARHVRTSIYVLILAAAVLAFVTIQVVILWIQNRKEGQPSTPSSSPVNRSSEIQQGSTSDEHSEEKDICEYNSSPVNRSSEQQQGSTSDERSQEKDLREYNSSPVNRSSEQQQGSTSDERSQEKDLREYNSSPVNRSSEQQQGSTGDEHPEDKDHREYNSSPVNRSSEQQQGSTGDEHPEDKDHREYNSSPVNRSSEQQQGSTGDEHPEDKDHREYNSSPVNRSSEQQQGSTGDEHPEDKDLREYLMLLGVLAASVTYQTGLKPPGGLWQDNNHRHTAGNSILHDINRGRYRAFFYSNSTSFMASIVVIVLLLPWNTHKLPLWPMHTAILLDMVGLLGAYAAGSTREWETSRHVIALVIPVLAYIAAYAAVLLFRNKRPCANAPAEIPPEAPQR